MKNRIIFSLSNGVLYFILTAFQILNGQSSPLNISKFTIESGTQFVAQMGHHSFYANDEYFFKNNNKFPKTIDGLVVQTLPMVGNPNQFFLSTISPGTKKSKILHYAIVSESGSLNHIKSVPLPFDQYMPRIELLNDFFILLQPENQSYTIINYEGETLTTASLNEKTHWSHEQTLFYTTWYNNHYLVSMEFTDYQNHPSNGILYLFDSHFNPNAVSQIPMSLPLHVESSIDGICAIVGITKTSSITSPIINLIFIDLKDNYRTSQITLNENPKSILWHNGQLLILNKSELISINPVTKKQTYTQYGSSFTPLDIISHNNSIYILGCNAIDITKEGPKYNSALLLEFENNEFIQHRISDDSFDTLTIKPSLNGAPIIIQGDQNIYKVKPE